jgi:hypothetical protein
VGKLRVPEHLEGLPLAQSIEEAVTKQRAAGRARSEKIGRMSARGAHLAPLVGVEQTAPQLGPKLSFAATGPERGVFVERALLGTAVHVEVVEHHVFGCSAPCTVADSLEKRNEQ